MFCLDSPPLCSTNSVICAGTIVPATEKTLFKRTGYDSYEAQAYQLLMKDALAEFVPRFECSLEHNDDSKRS